MKKILSYIFIVVGLALFAMSSVRGLLGKIYDKKAADVNKGWWGEHNGDWGDLVNMSYLDGVPKFCVPWDCKYKKPQGPCAEKTDLYIWGDSYTEWIPDSAFACVDSYHYGRNYFGELKYRLDPKKKNVLIIESAERYVLKYFTSRDIYNNVARKETAALISDKPKNINYAFFGVSLHKDDIFNPNINQNLEYNLFNYNFLNGIRKFKANMNYNVFNRASGGVELSENGEYLFVGESNTPNGIYSYRRPLPERDVQKLVTNINSIYQHYKKEGFAEVYLAIIPNPITILEPAYYNQMIPRLQTDPEMRMPSIDLYSVFKNHPDPGSVYRIGDTHWNNNGLQIWLRLVNEKLKNN